MERCCPNPYSGCEPLQFCFTDLAIRIPLSFEDMVITLRFTKQGGQPILAKINEAVVNNWAVVNIEAVPNGYFNPYSGAYTLEFLDANGIPFPFIAIDGKSYLMASFEFAVSVTPSEIEQLNFIDNNNY